MKQTVFMEKYPIFTLEIEKNECKFDSVDAIISYFRNLIDADSVADFIGGFDHYSHTKKIEGGEVANDILDAKLIAFCFGQKLLDPAMLSVRPRSIGVSKRQIVLLLAFWKPRWPQSIRKWKVG